MRCVVIIKVKWWFRYLYVPLMHFFLCFCRLFDENIKPDWDKINLIIIKATSVSNVEIYTDEHIIP